MLRPVTRVLPLALACAALTLGACGGVSGKGGPSTLPTQANPVTLTGGAAILAIDPQTAGLLEDNGITLTAVAPATMQQSAISFPITTGRIDGTSLGGTIDHHGGIRFASDAASVVLRDLHVDTHARQVTAAAGAGRLPVFDLDQRTLSGLPVNGRLRATGVVALLSPRASHALNAALKVSVFTPKLIIGDVSIDASTG